MAHGEEADPGPYACVPSVNHLPQTGISVLKGHIVPLKEVHVLGSRGFLAAACLLL